MTNPRRIHVQRFELDESPRAVVASLMPTEEAARTVFLNALDDTASRV